MCLPEQTADRSYCSHGAKKGRHTEAVQLQGWTLSVHHYKYTLVMQSHGLSIHFLRPLHLLPRQGRGRQTRDSPKKGLHSDSSQEPFCCGVTMAICTPPCCTTFRDRLSACILFGIIIKLKLEFQSHFFFFFIPMRIPAEFLYIQVCSVEKLIL